jgi:hypothetical protein
MKDKLVNAKNAVVANRTKILAVTTVVATTAVAIQARAIREHNKFLKENDLYDTYYAMDEDN